MKRLGFLILMVALALGLTRLAPLSPVAAQEAGTTLTAFKTAQGFSERLVEYDWRLTKTASISSRTVRLEEYTNWTYTLAATRVVASETIWKAEVRGQVCVTNTGTVATENLKIVDKVLYQIGEGPFQEVPGAMAVIIPPAQLGPGQTQCYPYAIPFTPIAGAKYKNGASVTITNYSGKIGQEFGPDDPRADFSLPSVPTTTVYRDATATLVEDVLPCPDGFTCGYVDSAPPSNRLLTGDTTMTYRLGVRNRSACSRTTIFLNAATLRENDTGQIRTATATVTITNTQQCK